MITSFIVILAVVMVTVGVNAFNGKQKSTANTASTTATATTPTTSNGSSTSTDSTSSTNSVAPSTSAPNFKDGTYSASDNYHTPGGQEGITVSITLQNGVVTSSSVQHQSNNHESEEYQSAFSAEYKQYVEGKKISEISSFARVSGSSLTAEGFDATLQQIESQAQAS